MSSTEENNFNFIEAMSKAFGQVEATVGQDMYQAITDNTEAQTEGMRRYSYALSEDLNAKAMLWRGLAFLLYMIGLSALAWTVAGIIKYL